VSCVCVCVCVRVCERECDNFSLMGRSVAACVCVCGWERVRVSVRV